MKKSVLFITMILLALVGSCFMFTACSKDESEPKTTEQKETSETSEKQEEAPRYYVKYEVYSSTGSKISCTQTITFTTDKGNQSVTQNGPAKAFSWEATYGPFKKGDKVILNVSNSTMDVQARIYASREQEPFVIKAESKYHGGASLSYTIDF
jgi:uncharacterized protein YxeA